MSLELYVFEGATGDGLETFTTLDADEARNYAQKYSLKWLAQIYEYSDTELVEDFTDNPEETE